MADMTLEQLRDKIRPRCIEVDSFLKVRVETLHDWADAIDAHLAGMGEPVGTLRIQLDGWDVLGIHTAIRDIRRAAGEYPLYLAPPASADVAALQSGDWDAVRKAVPTNWLDPLLTGPDAVIGSYPYSNGDIERLLAAVRQRLTAALPENAQ